MKNKNTLKDNKNQAGFLMGYEHKNLLAFSPSPLLNKTLAKFKQKRTMREMNGEHPKHWLVISLV